MKWYAGFETARIHWNERCMAEYSGHTPNQRMRENYDLVRSLGFAGARDGLRFDQAVQDRVDCAPDDFPVVWSLHHFGDHPDDPLRHARQCLQSIGQVRPLVIPVVEPGVGRHVSGAHPHESVDLAIRMMRELEGKARFLTGDPIHRLDEEELACTDALVSTGLVDVVGVHFYAHHACLPLSEVIQAVKRRYGLPVVVGETGYHDGHPGNEGRPHGCRDRREWIQYVEREAADVEWACWMPVIPINWDGGEPWPSSWPY